MSNNRLHTPGPWAVTANGLNVKSVRDVMISLSGDEAPISEQQANAALISAAPEMLSVIVQMRSFLSETYIANTPTAKGLVRFADLVIAKTRVTP